MSQMSEETLFTPINNKDYEAMYKLLAHDLIKNGICSTHLGYLETLYRVALLSLTTPTELPEKKEITIDIFDKRKTDGFPTLRLENERVIGFNQAIDLCTPLLHQKEQEIVGLKKQLQEYADFVFKCGEKEAKLQSSLEQARKRVGVEEIFMCIKNSLPDKYWERGVERLCADLKIAAQAIHKLIGGV